MAVAQELPRSHLHQLHNERRCLRSFFVDAIQWVGPQRDQQLSR